MSMAAVSSVLSQSMSCAAHDSADIQQLENTTYLVQHKVGMDLLCCHVGGAARAALLVDQMCSDALKAKTVTAVGDEWVSVHAHTYRTRKVILSKTEQSLRARLCHSSRAGVGLFKLAPWWIQ